MPNQTHYDILQVKETASPEVIRGAYRSLSQKWHPDKNLDNQAQAEQMFKRLNAAYSVLSDPTQRSAYDRQLRAEPVPQKTSTEQPKPKRSTAKVEAGPVNYLTSTLHAGARAVAFLVDFAVASSASLFLWGFKFDEALFRYTMVGGLVWAFFNAFWLSKTGNTPGKWLMGIKVSFQQRRPSFATAVERSLLIFGFSLGMGFVYTLAEVQFNQ